MLDCVLISTWVLAVFYQSVLAVLQEGTEGGALITITLRIFGPITITLRIFGPITPYVKIPDYA